MSAKRTLAGVASALVVAGTLVAVAPAASAATTSTPVACVVPSQLVIDVAVTVAAGDTLEFTKDPNCPDGPNFFFGIRPYGSQTENTPATVGVVEASDNGTDWTGAIDDYSYTVPVKVRYTAPADGTSSDSFYVVAAEQGSGVAGYLFTVTVGGPAASTTPPEMWFQSYGRAGGDTECLVGWSPSYAMWPNDGTGGWVCDRRVKKFG